MTQSDNSTCLVIGANGFIGSHIVSQLAAEDYRVVAFDRYSRPRQFNASERITEFKGDYFSTESIRSALKDVDYVIHTFSATTPFVSDADPYIDIKNNLVPTVAFLQECVAAQVKKVAFISSGGAVYGKAAERGSVSETSAPEPTSPYGIVKLAIEHYLTYFERKYGLSHISYRLTNPYGPGQIVKNNQGVIPQFVGKMRNGEDIVVYGDGSSARDYIYIEDACRMITSTFHKHTQYDLYNIGSGETITLERLISMIGELTGLMAKVKHMPEPKTFLHTSSVDMARFNQEFGHYKTISVKLGLQKYLSWLESGNQ